MADIILPETDPCPVCSSNMPYTGPGELRLTLPDALYEICALCGGSLDPTEFGSDSNCNNLVLSEIAGAFRLHGIKGVGEIANPTLQARLAMCATRQDVQRNNEAVREMAVAVEQAMQALNDKLIVI